MYINSFSPSPPRCAALPPIPAPPEGGGPDWSVFSRPLGMLLMMAAMEDMFSHFRGSHAAATTAPSFGVPRSDLRGPTRCTFAPPLPLPKQAPPPAAPPRPKAGGATVNPLRQRNSVSCGQTSVAMAVNALTGKKLTDGDVARKYGFSLLSALNSESRCAGVSWRDGGDFQRAKWPLLEKKLNREKTPVLIGLNGPAFSPSGRGHIVTLLSVDGDKVRYADPADGRIKTTTRRAIETAPPHPDGKFIFYATRG